MPVAPPVVSDKAKGPGSGGSAGSGSSVREVFGQQAGVGVVAAVDDKWKAMRATAISSFGNPKLMREYSRIVSEETVALIRRLQPYARQRYEARDHQPSVDLSFWVRRLTTEVICRIAFSKRLGLVTGKLPLGEEVDETMQMSDSLQRFLGNAGRVGRYQPIFQALSDVAKGSPLRSVLPDDMTSSIPGLTQLRKDTEVMSKYEKGLIEKRREGMDLGTDLLGKMMQTTVAGAHGPLSDADVQANVREAFVAGSETTGAAIAITLHQISNNPRIEWLVRKELKEVLGDKTVPDHEDLDRLPYLKMCIRETLRLYPSAHVFGRRAEKDIEVGGYLIKEGASVLMSPYYLGRDETQWGPDAHLYRPERHLGSDPLTATRSKFAWMPFGAGPRMCLGASLAMTEATVCVAGMLQNFKIRPLSSKLKYDYLITIELDDGVPVQLIPLRPMPEPLSEGPEWVVQPAPKAAKAVAAP
jgi:cytochrome P450